MRYINYVYSYLLNNTHFFSLRPSHSTAAKHRPINCTYGLPEVAQNL